MKDMISKNVTNNAKAIAIILVLMGHLVSSNKTTFPSYMQEFATFSVDVFLFLSGYGLTKSFDSNGIKGFLSKRFSAVYIPFLIATLITAMYRGFYDEKWPEIIKTLAFYSKTLPIDPTMWFIYFICSWYIFFWIIFSTFRNKTLQAIALFAISIAFTNFPNREYSYVLSSMFSLHSFSFPVGVIFARYITFNKSQLSLICAVFTSLFCILFYNITIKSDPALVGVSGIVFSISLITSLIIINKTNSALLFLGAHSYEIYLFEGIFRWNNFSNDKIINAILFFITAISLATFFKPLMERVKGLSLNTQSIIKKPQ
jgi:peptidoglycan/LPS O-acetylase OafA/YrhL